MGDLLISVIIPTYNRVEAVTKAIGSVLNQSYTHFELVVVDDASEDGTFASLKKQFGTRIKLVTQPHSGVSTARNLGVRVSQGTWIAFLDSDDIWHKNKLECQWAYLNTNPDLKISQTQELWIRNGKRVSGKKKHQKPSGYIFPQSLELCLVSPSSVIMTRELFEASGGFDENLPACEDYDLWLRISSQHVVGLLDAALLTKYGGHEDQLSHQYGAMDRFRVYSLLKILLSGQLTGIQRNQAKEAAKQKLNILKLGAQKRNSDFRPVDLLSREVFEGKITADHFFQTANNLLLEDNLFNS